MDEYDKRHIIRLFTHYLEKHLGYLGYSVDIRSKKNSIVLTCCAYTSKDEEIFLKYMSNLCKENKILYKTYLTATVSIAEEDFINLYAILKLKGEI